MSRSMIKRPRGTQARVFRNHARLLDAGVEVAADSGWGGLNLVNVSRHAGLSKRPAVDRFGSRTGLTSAMWRERLDAVLTDALRDVLAAGGVLDDPLDAVALNSALMAVTRPGPQLDAAVELLIASRYDTELEAAVRQGVAQQVREWCTPVPRSVTRALAARRGYLVLLSLGLLLASRRPGSNTFDPTPRFEELAQALSSDRKPMSLPRTRAAHVESTTLFDTDDPDQDALFHATLELVASLGFDGATTAGIAELAGFSEGKLYSRFDSKLDIFRQAIAAQQQKSGSHNVEFVQRVSREHSRGVAEALFLRELMHPASAQDRLLALEQKRVSWHEPEVMAAEEEILEHFFQEAWRECPECPEDEARSVFHYDYAVGIGLLPLAMLAPDSWSLPWDVITVPMIDGTDSWQPERRPRW